MLEIGELILDSWNKKHLLKHKVSIEEIYEVCLGKFRAKESFRKRIIIFGKTKIGRSVIVILSPEDRNGRIYGKGIYYVITAYEKE